MYVDSHAHLTSDQLFPHLDEILKRASLAKVTHMINICTDQSTLKRGLELNHPSVYNAASTTPHDVDTLGESDFFIMEKAAREGLLVAVGETGLDYHYEHSPKEKQQEFLIRYAKLAKECDLPLIIHCRDAFPDLFKILKSERVLIHCFTGTKEEAKEIVNRGWLLSLSGIVTFKKSHELKEVAQNTPLEHLLIETDAPYLSPEGFRGKTNEPSFLVKTAEVIGELRGLSSSELGTHTSQNALKFFRIDNEL